MEFEEKRSRIESDTPFCGQFLKVRRDLIFFPGSPPKVWDIVETAGAVAILPIDSSKNLILVEQWRRAVNQITLEIPAGLLNPGESPAECAQRELQEEIGYFAHSLEPFGGYVMSPGIMTEYVHLFLATDLVASSLKADDTDGIDLKILSLKEALNMIENKTIIDAKTALTILRYAHR